MQTVLIVDDSQMLLNYLEESFQEGEGKFTPIFAENGQVAIDILTEKSVSLLVTDLQMPEVDGLTLLAYSHRHHPTLPVIVMSAHGTPELVEKLQQQIIKFISKPFSAEQLYDAIESALHKEKVDGTITGISITSFLQLINMEQKTCLCSIESTDGDKGFFYFQGGELYHAIFGNLKGEQAAVAMLQLDDITISFRDPPNRKIHRAIKKGLMNVLMTGMRAKDETNS